MRLIELNPEFLKWIDDANFKTVNSVKEADGIWFVCPLCYKNNKNSVIGTHYVVCWCPNVPQTTSPIPGRWKINGNDFNDLTLIAGSSSVLLTIGCKAHFFITNGEIIFC